jgi:hypothetical protein
MSLSLERFRDLGSHRRFMCASQPAKPVEITSTPNRPATTKKVTETELNRFREWIKPKPEFSTLDLGHLHTQIEEGKRDVEAHASLSRS